MHPVISAVTGRTRAARASMSSLLALSLLGALALSLARPAVAQLSSNATVFYSGLDNPRGLKFGPDGFLYVAEGGQGGNDSTVGLCPQVPAPIGPYTGGGHTGRVSKISPDGKQRITVADDLPSSQTSLMSGGLVSGVSDIAFLDGTLYALLACAGCSHGVVDLPNGVVRVHDDKSWAFFADLSHFLMTHPVANPEPDDFEPDGTFYSLLAHEGKLYAVEPNHGELDEITREGEIRRIVDISASQGHIVPTALAFHEGHFYVGNLETFPLVQGGAKILKIGLNGSIELAVTGLTNIQGLAFDPHGNLFVLESTVGAPFPTPGMGCVVRVRKDGHRETVASGLSLATAMTFGPDGNLYVSNWGFGPPPGSGQIVKIAVRHDD
jgi:hypothetical protein